MSGKDKRAQEVFGPNFLQQVAAMQEPDHKWVEIIAKALEPALRGGIATNRALKLVQVLRANGATLP